MLLWLNWAPPASLALGEAFGAAGICKLNSPKWSGICGWELGGFWVEDLRCVVTCLSNLCLEQKQLQHLPGLKTSCLSPTNNF